MNCMCGRNADWEFNDRGLCEECYEKLMAEDRRRFQEKMPPKERAAFLIITAMLLFFLFMSYMRMFTK